MKKIFFAAGAGLLMAACTPNVPVNDDLVSNQDSISYALGVSLGQGVEMQFKQFPIDTIDMKHVAKALAISQPNEQWMGRVAEQLDSIDAVKFRVGMMAQLHGEAKITPEEANDILNAKAQAKRAEAQKEREAQAAKNLVEGQAFLEENAKAEGVVTLESGLQYKVITAGKGAKPTENDRVKCHYRGTLINGDEFDASKEDAPATFAVKGVIKGWQEALPLMTVGSKWQLFVPAALAYGERGAGANIGPNCALIFEVELLEIVK